METRRRTEGGRSHGDAVCGGEPHTTGGFASGSQVNGVGIGMSHRGDPCSGCRPRSRGVSISAKWASGIAWVEARGFSGDEPGRPPRRIGPSVGSDVMAARPACPASSAGPLSSTIWRSGCDERWCTSQVRSIGIAIYNRRAFAKIVRGIFHDSARPSVQVVCGLGEGTREENIP